MGPNNVCFFLSGVKDMVLISFSNSNLFLGNDLNQVQRFATTVDCLYLLNKLSVSAQLLHPASI